MDAARIQVDGRTCAPLRDSRRDAAPGRKGLLHEMRAVSHALNKGDLRLGRIANRRLRLHVLAATAARLRNDLVKASPDDPDHPGWPAGTEGGRGGQFRPKDGASPEIDRRCEQERIRSE